MNSIFDKLIKETNYTDYQSTWSPHYSSVGICAGGDVQGAGTLYFHYNRFTRPVFGSLISFPLMLNTEKSDVVRLFWGGDTSLAATDANSFIFESGSLEKVGLFCAPSDLTGDFRFCALRDNVYFFRGFSATKEARDPDREVPFGISLAVEKGIADFSDGFIIRAQDGEIRFSLVISVLHVSEERMFVDARRSLNRGTDSAVSAGYVFWREIASRLPSGLSAREEEILAKSVRTLILNTVQGEGSLKKHLSCYPNRGEYPTHFLWDTYFQNLGYCVFDSKSAVDFLVQIVSNIRPDGKLPQFMCSTWARPEDSQGPLLGWAVMNVIDEIKNPLTLTKIYHALERNTGWWLSARLAPCGLVWSPSGLETGQDDAPRFDGGATVPCDMNAYLLSQIKATAHLAGILGYTDARQRHLALADDFSKKIYDNLYCREDGLFYDISRKTGEFVKVRSNACVLPVWAGVKMPDVEKKQLIENFLLDENAMFGEIPFPSVAYDDSHYESSKWWRGPTWMPIAYLLAETLRNNGYIKEYNTACDRLYTMLVNDGMQHELFDSRTGRGLGSVQQGWTAGIFIRMAADKQKNLKED